MSLSADIPKIALRCGGRAAMGAMRKLGWQFKVPLTPSARPLVFACVVAPVTVVPTPGAPVSLVFARHVTFAGSPLHPSFAGRRCCLRADSYLVFHDIWLRLDI